MTALPARRACALRALTLESHHHPAQSLNPPKLDRIPVQAIADCGVVQTASGPRNVNKGETHFMSRAECEPLVRQGLMVQVPMD